MDTVEVKTICVNCKHHLFREIDVHYCSASPLPQAQDPVIGVFKSVHYINSDGFIHFTHSRWALCYNINKGNCEKFVPSK